MEARTSHFSSWTIFVSDPKHGMLFTPVDFEAALAKLFGRAVRVVDFEVTNLEHDSYSPSTVNIFVLKGQVGALDKGCEEPFSLFAKIIKKDSGIAGNVREDIVYEEILSGINPSSSLRWPIFLGSNQLRNGLHVIWLEAVSGTPGPKWTIDDWRGFATALSHFQVELSESGSLPLDQLSSDDLRDWVENDRGKYFPGIFEHVDLVADLLSREDFELVEWGWESRQDLLDKLDRLPQTLCHNDVWSGNLVKEKVATESSYVLLDWALTGTGPLGADLAFAVLAEIWLLVGSIEDPVQLKNTLLDGYLSGLAESKYANLTGDALEGFSITAALRWSLMLGQLISDAKDSRRVEELARSKLTTVDRIMKQRASLVRAGCELMAELQTK